MRSYWSCYSAVITTRVQRGSKAPEHPGLLLVRPSVVVLFRPDHLWRRPGTSVHARPTVSEGAGTPRIAGRCGACVIQDASMRYRLRECPDLFVPGHTSGHTSGHTYLRRVARAARAASAIEPCSPSSSESSSSSSVRKPDGCFDQVFSTWCTSSSPTVTPSAPF